VAGAAIALHRPLAGAAVGCKPFEFCEGPGGARAAGRRMGREAAGAIPAAVEVARRCEMPVAIDAIEVEGDRARAVAAWPSQNGNRMRMEHRLQLRKLAGTWRVTEDSGRMF